jgi:transcriptional regulator with GAF, ATPase, and Fis domain
MLTTGETGTQPGAGWADGPCRNRPEVSDVVEVQLTDVFIEMADTLVADFDMIDFLHLLTERCVQLLDVSATGLLLTDQRGALRVTAASTEQTRLLELFQLQVDEGPCLDCFRSGRVVSVDDLSAAADRWPQFAPAAVETGFAAVAALPMRLRDEGIGALNLFDVQASSITADKQRIGQALADIATIGILQERAIRSRDTLTRQLETALHSRIIIEQAKGVIAERQKVDPGQAFARLRDTSRANNRRLAELAQAIVDGSEQLPPAP